MYLSKHHQASVCGKLSRGVLEAQQLWIEQLLPCSTPLVVEMYTTAFWIPRVSSATRYLYAESQETGRAATTNYPSYN